MITVICNAVAIIAYAAAGIWCGVRAVRTQRELTVLRDLKKKRRAERESDGWVSSSRQDLLYLLKEHEKRELVDTNSPLPKWLGDKTVADLPAFDAAYLAGYALREKSWHQLKSLAAASVGVNRPGNPGGS